MPFRILHCESIAERVVAIRDFGLRLRRVIRLREVSGLVVNHLSTRFVEGIGSDARRTTLSPALGENWAAMSDLQLLLECTSQRRRVLLTRSDLCDNVFRELEFSITVPQNAALFTTVGFGVFHRVAIRIYLGSKKNKNTTKHLFDALQGL